MTASDNPSASGGLPDDSAAAFSRTGADISTPTDSPYHDEVGPEEIDADNPDAPADDDLVLEDEPLYDDSDPATDQTAAPNTPAAEPTAEVNPSAEDLSDPEGDGLAAKLDVDPARDDVKG